MKGDRVKTATAKAVMRVYARIALKHPLILAVAVFGVVGMQVASLVTPIYLRNFFNFLTAGPTAHSVSDLTHVLVFISAGWLAYWVFNRMEHFGALYLITGGMADAVSEAFSYLIDHSYNFFISNFAGSLTHKVNKFAKSYQVLYEAIFISFVPAFLFIVGAIVILTVYNSIVGLILTTWVVVFVSFQIWASNKRQPLRRVRADLDTKITGTLADAISNQATITLFSGTNHEIETLNTVAEDWRKAGVRSWGADGYVWSVTDLLVVVIQIILMYTAIIFWSRGLLTIGDFVLIQTYLLIIFGRLSSIQHDLKRAYDALADGGEMVDILTASHDIQDQPDAQVLHISKAAVEFKNISFSFQNTQVLKNLRLGIGPQEKIGLVGPSGAGKTTITKLLLRLYDVKNGSIEIDGQDISKVKQESLRNAISFVPQEPVLFHRSLMDNIRYGKRDATEAEVIEAAKKAHCHEFISSLPEGYNTFVGERGVKLSGGERQRVAIARAILKNSPILVLDEATSSLDSESEALIQDALATLMQGKTVIVIAHRLSTIMKMDRIVVLEGGSIVAEGTHAELLAHGGLYHKLWSIQAGGFIVDEAELAEGLK
ncbi:MAG TPA: ABC transporter ATP-binding protein [Candidatus Paceibacterota bacterium]|nr:ABC transporter ATP-binding protein [Candidatus Paceibacterota bacterium]